MSTTYLPLRERCTDVIADAMSCVYEVGFPEIWFGSLPRERWNWKRLGITSLNFYLISALGQGAGGKLPLTKYMQFVSSSLLIMNFHSYLNLGPIRKLYVCRCSKFCKFNAVLFHSCDRWSSSLQCINGHIFTAYHDILMMYIMIALIPLLTPPQWRLGYFSWVEHGANRPGSQLQTLSEPVGIAQREILPPLLMAPGNCSE